MGDSNDEAEGSASVSVPSETATATVSSSVSDIAIPDLSRLPKNVQPKRYELKMEVDPQKKTYIGLVNIRLYFHGDRTTRIVWLHAAKNVSIESAHVWFSQFMEMPIQTAEVIRVPEKECIGVRLITPVRKGDRAWLGIHFRGNILDGMQGLFSTTYIDKNGKRRLGAATMFAATEARSCFPCFDEPDFKAIFALEVTVPKKLMVISNMPVMDTEYVDNNRQKLHVKYFL